MSPPMVPAPMTCTLRGLKPSLGASSFSISDSLNTRRKLREASLAISGVNISVSAIFMRAGSSPYFSNRSISRNGAG